MSLAQALTELHVELTATKQEEQILTEKFHELYVQTEEVRSGLNSAEKKRKQLLKAIASLETNKGVKK